MGRPAFVLFMAHINSVIQNIQLVSSLLYSYCSTTSEELYILGFNHLSANRILIVGMIYNGTSHLF